MPTTIDTVGVTISTYVNDAPDRALQDEATFDSNASYMAGKMKTQPGEYNSLKDAINNTVSGMNTVASEVDALASAASANAAAAEVAAQALNFQGSYASGTPYAVGESVISGGLIYVSLQNSNTGNDPSASPTYWKKLGGMGLVPLSTATPSYDSSVEFTLPAGYTNYKLLISNLRGISSDLYLRTSTNGGASYDSGASDYIWEYGKMGSSYAGSASSNDSKIIIGPAGSSSQIANGEINIYQPSNPDQPTFISWSMATGGKAVFGAGIRNTSADVDAIQLLLSSGSIYEATITLYGVAE